MISSIYIPLHTGEESITTTSATNPTGFGGSGSHAEKYTSINISELFPKGNIVYAKLIAQLYIETSTNNWDANVKIGLKFEGSSAEFWTPTYTKLLATSPGVDAVSFALDLIDKLPDLTDGKLLTGIGAWRSNGSGSGTILIGADNETNPNAYYGIRIVGE